jgi:hypothetical protein
MSLTRLAYKTASGAVILAGFGAFFILEPINKALGHGMLEVARHKAEDLWKEAEYK